ncbi:MAG: hypothetical protein WC640_01740 [Candidatus Paceibacterota bacterium]|jgi:hypothetical protein
MTSQTIKRYHHGSVGYLLVQVLVYGAIGLIILGSLIGWAGTNLQLTKKSLAREKALQIAEAGIEYYRWHLAHAPQDFKDGQITSGPYVHDYFDKSDNKIGSFTLDITAPVTGSTIVTVVSTGRVITDPQVARVLEVKFAVPSLGKYALVANTDMRFGIGTETFGPIHSNGGIRFDGLAHNIVTSAKAKYNDPDHNGDQEFGVHTHMNPPPPAGSMTASFRPFEAPPSTLSARTDVFLAGRKFPVPAFDFNGLTADLADMKIAANNGGLYFAASGALGYNLVLKTDNTFDLYKVDTLLPPPKNHCSKQNADGQEGWGTWSVNDQTFVANYTVPTNGMIFVEDNVWVEGQVNETRVTIATGRFPENPSTDTNITINNNLKYTNYDGRDIVALVGQNNVNIGMDSQNFLEIDAALVAKNGRVGRYYYTSDCQPYDQRDTIRLYGMIATNERYGFAYTNSNNNMTMGYQNRYITYDNNLLYSPPPFFPSTSDQYQIISWREK